MKLLIVLFICYVVACWLIYRNFFGAHAIQVIDSKPLVERFLIFLGNLRLMTVGYYSLFIYVPVALLTLVYLVVAWLKPKQVKYEGEWYIWHVFCLFFVLGVAFLVPAGAGGKQWGPRFLLFLVPLLIVLFAWQLDYLLKIPDHTNGRMGRIGWGLVLIAGLVGIIQNPIRGSDFLMQTYAPVEATVAELRSEAEPVVAISDPFLGQLFEPALGRNVILLWAATDENLSILSEALAAQNLPSFSYICYSFDCRLFSLNQKSKQLERNGINYNLQMVKAREYGIYTVFDIRLSP